MLEDPSGSRKDGQRTAPQRSNRVFILEYSPERSKSKKQKQWDNIEPKKQKLSSFLTRREILSEKEPTEELSHRKNLDRLASLISRTRSSRDAGEEQSGCEKLIKAIEKIFKFRKHLAEALESLKKYSMLCSSSNYELFIQSKHQYLLKDRRSNEPSSPLDSINERHSIEEGPNSYQNSQLSPLKNPLSIDLTFRKKADEVLSPLQESILRGLESPRKCLEPFKLSREYIPTAQTLNSHSQLPLLPALLPRLCSTLPSLAVLNETPLRMTGSREQDFLHLCHLQPHESTVNRPDEQGSAQEIDKLLGSLPTRVITQEKPSLLAGSFSKGKLDFALPTPVAPSPTHRAKVSINYVSEGTQAESFRRNKRHQPVLSAKQIADRMLFGREAQAVPEKVIPADKLEVVQPKRKRVSSLPKITFTYTSREKDMYIKSPSTRCIPLPAEPLKTVLKVGSPRKKEELHSTFGSTQMAVNSSNSRGSRLQSPQQLETPSRVVRIAREPTSYNPFAGRPLAPAAQTPRIDSEYYGGFSSAQKQPIVTQEQLRPRIVTQAFPSSNEIEYVGIEQQPRGCCWAKETRSKSLNDRVLVGFSPRSPW